MKTLRRWWWMAAVGLGVWLVYLLSSCGSVCDSFIVHSADVLNDYCFCNGMIYDNHTVLFYTSRGFIVLNNNEYFYIVKGGRVPLEDTCISTALHEYWIYR
jgi:hypothetical protein